MILPHLSLLLTTAIGTALAGSSNSGNAAQSVLSTLGPVVDLGYTTVVGNASSNSVNFFGGIPYVKPPLGDLRWRAPVRLDETTKNGANKPELDARWFGPLCIQQPAIVGVGDEDCVTLNVWAPAGATASSNLPVIVYIHGGGNYYNSAQGFPMAHWVEATGGQLVAVSIQYRLGLLGFLASSKLMANGVANAGLLDQRAALEWIQRHIGAFGGDPKHVTISGESSGGGSVLNHLVWKDGGDSSPPFSAAILQSIGNDPFGTADVYEQCFNNVTTFTGCDRSTDVMACLRNTPARVLVQAVNHRPQPLCKYLPIVDGVNILDFPSVSLTKGHFSKMPVLAGHVNNEGTTFVGSPTSVTNTAQLYTALTSSRFKWLSNATFERGLALYNQSEFTSFYDMAQTLTGQTEFSCWDWYLANRTAAAGQRAYTYRWNTPDPVQLAAASYKGVVHTSDLYFLFQGTNSGVSASNAQNTFVPFNSTESLLASEAVAYWTSFARSYDPTAHKLATSPDWPALNVASGGAQRMVPWQGGANGTASYVEEIPQAEIDRCLFWISAGNETRV